jgi:hypothetical protein
MPISKIINDGIGSITGDLTVDTNTLHVDSTNNRVGIGTVLPLENLNVNGTLQLGTPAQNATTAVSITNRVVSDPVDTGRAAITLGTTAGVSSSDSYIAFTTDKYGVSRAERMRIDSTGKVGIGTSSPTQALELNFTGYGGMVVNSSNNAGMAAIRFDSTSGAQFNQVQSAHMEFRTADTERMRIDSSGNVMVGTTTALGQITSLSDGTKFQYAAHNTDSSGAGQTSFRFMRNSADVGSITTTASNTAFNTSSDYRLKENVTGITNGITRVKQLNPSRFNFIIEPDKTVDGFLAHEAQTVVPEAVTGTQDAMRDEEYEVTPATGDIFTPASAATFDEAGNELTAATDEVIHSTNVEQPDELADGQQWRETTAAVMGTRTVPDYQGIDQSKLVPLLTAALKEAIAKIETLETKVAATEERLADTETRLTALEAG